MDYAVHKLGVEPAELRRRNFIRPQAMPHTTPLGLVYDSGDFGRNMEDALGQADLAGFAARRAESRRAAAAAASATPSISSSPASCPTNSPNCASTPPAR